MSVNDEADLLATIRATCLDAERAMAAHVTAALPLILPGLQPFTHTEADVERVLRTLIEELVAWQLANSEPWGADEDARRPCVEVLARAVVGQARAQVARALQDAARSERQGT